MTERYHRILRDPLFSSELARIQQLEGDRIYCGHDICHLLDVARITYISVLERLLSDPAAFCGRKPEELKDLIYAAALLHDIGRGREYEEGISHDRASAAIAEEILPRCEYSPEESDQILRIIRSHRGQDAPSGDHTDLAILLKEADRLSRLCFTCSAADTCKWDSHKKNQTIIR